MKKSLGQYAAYNLWANGLMTEYILRNAESLKAGKESNSLHDLVVTLLSIRDEESLWWQRLRMQERISLPSETATVEAGEVSAGLLQQSRQWHEWISKAASHVFEHEFIYQSSRRESFKQSTHQVLIHLFNQASFYRGQLTLQLKQLHLANFPLLDFMQWSRKK